MLLLHVCARVPTDVTLDVKILENVTLDVIIDVKERVSLFVYFRDSMSLRLGRSFLVSAGLSRGNEKSSPLSFFFDSKKRSNSIFNFDINEFFVLLSS